MGWEVGIGWVGDNELGMLLMELVCPTFIGKVIFIKLVFLEVFFQNI